MITFDFLDVARLLNASRTVSINTDPLMESKGRWALYAGEYRVHVTSIPFTLLYLAADATNDSLEDAARRAFEPGKTQVVYANSLDTRKRKLHVELFADKAKGFWTAKEYLASFIRDDLALYLDRMKALKPEFYIDPQVETPLGPKGKIPNPLLGFLRMPQPETASAGGIAVLLGDPGQGKTYMSQYLVSELARTSVVPIYINSTQWNTIPKEHLGSLWKTITHSFRHFEAPISWLEGQEEQFLRATLKADLFKIVFDGFDEYILKNDGRVSVTDALAEFVTLAQSTGARIVITSRVWFWDSSQDSDAFQKETRSSIYRICPFDQQHARNYFAKRLGDKTSADKAVGLYGELAQRDASFVGRGFVLKLVADLVASTTELPARLPAGTRAMEWLMESFCAREVVRQALPLNASQQMKVFQHFAAEVAMGEEPTSDLLEFSILEAVPGLDGKSRTDCIERLTPHPLLQRDSSTGRWDWSQEQVGFVFLAQWLLARCKGHNGDSARLKTFFHRQTLPSGRMADLAAMMVELAGGDGAADRELAIHAAIKAMLTAAGADSQLLRPPHDTRALISALATKGVDRCLPAGASHRERAALFVHFCQGPPVHNVPIAGTMSRMDLRGAVFQACRFERVVWVHVTFDETTVFSDCHFSGGQAEGCHGLGLARFNDGCTWDVEADALLRKEQVREGSRRYTADDLRNDMKAVLDKFVVGGGVSFRSVNAVHLKRGAIRGSRYADLVVSELVAKVLDHHEISGVTEGGYHIREDARESLRFYAANGVLTGLLKDVYDTLRGKIGTAE